MLVLTRHPGEKVLIGDSIVLEVKEIQGREATFSIDGPERQSRTVTMELRRYIQVCEHVRVHLRRVAFSRVGLGFDAPRSIRITRWELIQKNKTDFRSRGNATTDESNSVSA